MATRAAGFALILVLVATGCGSGGLASSTPPRTGQLFTSKDVTRAFQQAGIALQPFGKVGSAKQFVAYLTPPTLAIVVDVFPPKRLAQLASQPAGLNGRSVPAIGTRNVVVWIARQATSRERSRVTRALALLG